MKSNDNLQLGDKLAGAYGAVKRSMWYPFGLLVGTVTWWLGNEVFHFDPGLVNLLTILSIEATIATSLVQRDQAHQEEMLMVQLKTIRHILEAIRADRDSKLQTANQPDK